MIQPIDWSATAAWIALVISIIGTLASPIITAIITNKHQIKLREQDIKQKTAEKYEDARTSAINSFIANTGRYLTSLNNESTEDFSKSFHIVYQYVPETMWNELDQLYKLLLNQRSGTHQQALEAYSNIIRKLSAILKEAPPKYP